MENKSENSRVLYIMLIAVFLFFWIAACSVRDEEFDFNNKISLPIKYSHTFKGDIYGKCSLTDQGMLVGVSLKPASIYFINDSDGSIIDTIKLNKEFGSVSTITRNNLLYCIFDQTYLYIIDTNTFMILNDFYSRETQYFEYPFAFYENFLLTYNRRDEIAVVNTDNGEVIAYKKVNPLRSIELFEDILFYSTNGDNIFALNPTTLNEIWEYDNGGNNGHAENVIYSSEKVFLNSFNKMFILDTKTGRLLDSYPFEAREFIVKDNLIYSDSIFGITYSNIENQSTVWRREGEYSGINVSEDSVFTYNEETRNLERIDRFTGELFWQTEWMPDGINSYVEFDDYYIFENYSLGLYLVEKTSGEKLWAYKKLKNTSNIMWYMNEEDLVVFNGNELIVYETTSL